MRHNVGGVLACGVMQHGTALCDPALTYMHPCCPCCHHVRHAMLLQAARAGDDALRLPPLSEVVQRGLCPPVAGTKYHKLSCLLGECDACSMSNCIQLSPLELLGCTAPFKVSYYGRRLLDARDNSNAGGVDAESPAPKKARTVLDMLVSRH